MQSPATTQRTHLLAFVTANAIATAVFTDSLFAVVAVAREGGGEGTCDVRRNADTQLL